MIRRLLLVALTVLVACWLLLPFTVQAQSGFSYVFDFTEASGSVFGWAAVTAGSPPCTLGNWLSSGPGDFFGGWHSVACVGIGNRVQLSTNLPSNTTVTSVTLSYTLDAAATGVNFRAFSAVNDVGTTLCTLTFSTSAGVHTMEVVTGSCVNARSWLITIQMPTGSNAVMGYAKVVGTSTIPLTYTPSPVASATNTATFTPSYTFTPSDTFTPSFTPTFTPSITNTPTKTFTPSSTFTPSFTPTFTPSITNTPTKTFTPSSTYTFTPSQTFTPSFTSTPTNTFTPSMTVTPSYTPLLTLTPTPTSTPGSGYHSADSGPTDYTFLAYVIGSVLSVVFLDHYRPFFSLMPALALWLHFGRVAGAAGLLVSWMCGLLSSTLGYLLRRV